MKAAEYKLPAGVHDRLEPRKTGTTPSKKDPKTGAEIEGKPIYEYTTIKTPEAESTEEFLASQVEQDKPEDHMRSLAQAQFDIIIQRKIREAAQSEAVDDMYSGKDPETKDLDDDERHEYVMQHLQDVADGYRYGARSAGTGGVAKKAKDALAREQAVKKAAEEDPEVAALQAKLAEKMAALGITNFGA